MFSTKFIPLADRVLVQRVKQETKSAGGVFLPESSEPAKTLFGKVFAVGKGRVTKEGELKPCGIKEGETVLIPEFGGTRLKLGGEEFFVFREEDIIGVLKD
jgi:chaperonin GroES